MFLIALAVIGILTLALCVAVAVILHAISVDRQVPTDALESP